VWRRPLRRFEAGLRESCGITSFAWHPRWGLGTWVEKLEGDGSDEMEDGLAVLPLADLRQARLLGRAEGLVAFRAGDRLYYTDRAHAAAWHLDKTRMDAGHRMGTNR
jgi:hypothetical protein